MAATADKGAGMRICVLAYSFYEFDTRIQQYSKALLARGDEVDVIALRRPDQPSSGIFEGAKVYRIQGRTVDERGPLSYLARILRFLLRSTWTLTRLHARRKYDIVHVHSVPDFLVFAAIPAKLFGARVILDIHDILPEFYASKFGIHSDSLLFKMLVAVERTSAWCAHKVIVANELWEERLASRSVPAAKCTTIRNYPDPDIFVRQVPTRTDQKYVILYPGSLNYHQGLDIAIRAFAKALPNLQNAEFHIYGEGRTLTDLKNLAHTLGLTSSVIFHPGVPARDVPRLMSNADLSIVPKRASSSFGTEAASTKIMEFMSMGVPVIVSRTKIDSLYHNLSRVEFFESENVDQLAAAIVRLKQDSNRRKELTRNGLKYVQEHDWAIKKRDYLNLLDEVASNPQATRAQETKLAEGSARRPTSV